MASDSREPGRLLEGQLGACWQGVFAPSDPSRPRTMPSTDLLLIDDVRAAMSLMSEAGREIADKSTSAIRSAVLEFCLRRNWSLLSYDAYVEWATVQIGADNRTWIVLDPLFPIDHFGDRVRRVRMTRLVDETDGIVTRRYLDMASTASLERVHEGEVGILDDAAASGMTIQRAMRAVGKAGGRVSRILVGASSRTARDGFRAAHSGCEWTEFMRGAWRTVHLRDGCPHLPYTGKPTAHGIVELADGSQLDVRVPLTEVSGHPWQILVMDRLIRDVISGARTTIAQRLSSHLGRAACVPDLSILGASVPVLVKPGATVTREATLESLLGA